MARYPDRIVFDEEPAGDDLHVIVGPDMATSAVQWTEDEATIRIEPARIPFRPVLVFLVVFFGALSAAPWVLPGLGVRLPPVLSDGVVIGLTAALWLLILPAFVGILLVLDRATAKLGPGAVIAKDGPKLMLPWIGVEVPAGRVVRFVQVEGRHRYSGNVSLFGQYCVVFRDEADRFVYAPLARLTGRTRGDDTLARLGKVFDRPIERIRVGTLD